MTTVNLSARTTNWGVITAVSDGSGASITTPGTTAKVGWDFDTGSGVDAVGQLLFEVDFSPIPIGSTITALVFTYRYFNVSTSNNYAIQLRAYNYGASVSASNWRTHTQFAALTLCAHSTTPPTGGNSTLTSDAGFIGTITPGAINRFILCSNQFAAFSIPDPSYNDVDQYSPTSGQNFLIAATYTPPSSAMFLFSD